MPSQPRWLWQPGLDEHMGRISARAAWGQFSLTSPPNLGISEAPQGSLRYPGCYRGGLPTTTDGARNQATGCTTLLLRAREGIPGPHCTRNRTGSLTRLLSFLALPLWTALGVLSIKLAPSLFSHELAQPPPPPPRSGALGQSTQGAWLGGRKEFRPVAAL